MDRDWGAPDALAFVRRDGLRPVDGRVRRGVREGGLVSKVGFVTMGESARRGRHPHDRRRHARLRVHGQGPLERVQDARLHDLAAAADAAAGLDRGPQRGGRGGRGAPLRLHRSRDGLEARSIADDRDRRLRQLRPEQLPRRADDRGRRGGQARDLREAAGAHRRRGLRDLAARAGDGREGDVRLQLPLRARRAARARRSSSRASSARSSTSAGATCRSGSSTPTSRWSGGSTRTSRAPARSATSART